MKYEVNVIGEVPEVFFSFYKWIMNQFNRDEVEMIAR